MLNKKIKINTEVCNNKYDLSKVNTNDLYNELSKRSKFILIENSEGTFAKVSGGDIVNVDRLIYRYDVNEDDFSHLDITYKIR